MKIDIVPKPTPVNSLAIGVFDGVHIGHKALLEECDAALSFNPHPAVVLSKCQALSYLSTINERRSLMTDINTTLYTLTFTTDIAKLSPLEFLNKMIKDSFHPKKIVVGYDFRFGKNQKGDITLLETWGESENIDILIIPKIHDASGKLIKSGRIRHIIEDDFDKAIELLGHPYLIEGTVIKGENRGKALGYPTANLQVPDHKCIPSSGVYEAETKIDGSKHKSIAYIGSKPTFEGQTKGIEVHIRHYSEPLYGKIIQLYLKKKIRNEIKFKNQDALIQQIKEDIQSID